MKARALENLSVIESFIEDRLGKVDKVKLKLNNLYDDRYKLKSLLIEKGYSANIVAEKSMDDLIRKRNKDFKTDYYLTVEKEK